ncbi:uncharacterized protein LOC119667485 [Teleopsis dalmanni]|uniref:uncharacterized protein LOC119667485 n=1 Tax=Teleopsis dalmanni TaxID=139649 RepID=UPI0018CF5100|nr:uncharacterized protein LOC119667485 [Teleopsis dalmanni]
MENALLKSPIARSKRGAINIIGNVANSLFGVLDSNYETEMKHHLSQIYDNEEYLNKLLKNHTSILDATLNILKQTQDASKRKFTDLDAQIKLIMSTINNVSNALDKSALYYTFTSLALQVLTLTHNFQMQQQALIDAITDGHHGKINPLLISTDQFRKELQNIRTHLSQNLQLPIEDDSILEYFRLIELKLFKTDTQVVFSLLLPLVDSETFELFQLTPIPAAINGSLVIINPLTRFIGINLHKEQLYPMNKELVGCHEVSNNIYLCYQQHPIYRANAEIGKCEMDLFHNKDATSCQLQRLDQNTTWFQLHNSNQWIYGMSTSYATTQYSTSLWI